MSKLRQFINILGWDGLTLGSTGIAACLIGLLDFTSLIDITNDPMARMVLVAVGLLMETAVINNWRLAKIVKFMEKPSVEFIDTEEELYRRSINALRESKTRRIKSTGLARRSGNFSASFRAWSKAVDDEITSGNVIQHIKIIKLWNSDTIKKVQAEYENVRKKHESAETWQFLTPKTTPALDVLILENKEVWIAFPRLKDEDGLKCAIRIKSEQVATEMGYWYDSHLWKDAEDLTTAAKRLDDENCEK